MWLGIVEDIKKKLSVLYNYSLTFDIEISDDNIFVFEGRGKYVITNMTGEVLKVYNNVRKCNRINKFIVLDLINSVVVYDVFNNTEVYSGLDNKIYMIKNEVIIKDTEKILKLFLEGRTISLSIKGCTNIHFINEYILLELATKDIEIYNELLIKVKLIKKCSFEGVLYSEGVEYAKIRSIKGGLTIIDMYGNRVLKREYVDIKELYNTYMFMTMDFSFSHVNTNPEIDNIAKTNKFYRMCKNLGSYANTVRITVYNYNFKNVFSFQLDNEFVLKYDSFGVYNQYIILQKNNSLDLINIKDSDDILSINLETSNIRQEHISDNKLYMFSFSSINGEINVFDYFLTVPYRKKTKGYYHILSKNSLQGVCNSEFEMIIKAEHEQINILSEKGKLLILINKGVIDVYSINSNKIVMSGCSKIHKFIENINTLICEVDGRIKMVKI